MGQLQWIRNLRADFHSEREVETDIVLAIASHLGYGPQDRAIGYSIPGSRQQADVVLFTGEQHIPAAALVVFEAKKPDNPQDPLPQAKRYAELLGAPLYATCNGERLAIYSAADHRLQFEASTLDLLEERWHELEAVLHRSILMARHSSRQLPQDMEVQASAHERTYRRRVLERFGQIQVLYRHEGIDLRRVYVATRVARIAKRPVLRSAEEDDRFPERVELRPGSEPRRADLVVREHPHLVVIGDLGTGKTTMLRYLALELASGNISSLEAVIPVYISLNELFKARRQHDSIPIEEYFFEYFRRDAERMGIPRGDVWLRWWLQRGSVILLWDGLDEVTGFATSQGGDLQAAEEAITLIRFLAEQYRDTHMVLTARRGAWQHRVGNLPPHFLVVETLPFRPEEIETFVRAWFSQEPEKADVLLHALEAYPQTNQLASNPLMLTFMAIRYEETGELPGRDRHYLFSDTVDLLLHYWDRDPGRRVDRRPILKLVVLRQLLGELALRLHTDGNRFMTKREFQRWVTAFLADVPRLAEQMDDIIEHDLETKFGLIRPFFAGEYGFLHHSVQEFFAAEAIDRYHWDEWWPTGRLLAHVGEPWWDEVFIQLAGGGHAETVMRALVDGEDDLFHTRLLLAGRCLAGASARIDRAVQERVIEGLFSLLGTVAGSRSAVILADIGTTAIAGRLMNAARSGTDIAVTMQSLDSLRRLRHPKAGTLALASWEKGHVLHDAILDLTSSADSAEVDRLAALARLLTPPDTMPLFILARTTSPHARPALRRLMATPEESPAIRFAAALALADTVPEAVTILMRLWEDPKELEPVWWPSIPPLLAIELVTRIDLQQISSGDLDYISDACQQHGFRVTDRRLQGLVAGARVLLGGRDTRKQVAGARLLAVLGDETIRAVARRWLNQQRRADHAFTLIAEFWPSDLLEFTVPIGLVRNYVINHRPWLTRQWLTDLARRAAPAVVNWWQLGLVQDDPAAHFALLTALVEAGVTEAVPEFCAQLSRPARPTWRATAEAVAALVAQAGGRQFLLNALARPDTWSEGEMRAILVALPASDRELLAAGLQPCISLIGKSGERWDLLDALQHMARELDLFIWRDPSGEICHRPRQQQGAM